MLDLMGGRPPPAGVGADWQAPPIPRPLDDPVEQAWSDVRRSHQPMGTFTEPVRLPVPLEDLAMQRTYVKASADPAEMPDSAFWRAAAHARASPRWQYREVETHTWVALSRPRELADLLLAC